jgi:hypothetical protein
MPPRPALVRHCSRRSTIPDPLGSKPGSQQEEEQPPHTPSLQAGVARKLLPGLIPMSLASSSPWEAEAQTSHSSAAECGARIGRRADPFAEQDTIALHSRWPQR